MIDTTLLRDNPQKIAQAAKDKRIELNTEHIAHIDAEYRKVLVDVQTLRESRNRFAKDRDIEAGKRIKGELDQKEKALEALKQELDTLLLTIPNPAKDDVKVGKDDTENDVIRTYKSPKEFAFPVKDHLEIGEYLNMIDMERAAKVSGARFVYLKNDGVLLELALIQFALKTLMKEGFTPVITPDLIKKETMQGLGYMENGGDEDMFQIPSDDLVLVGTAEHALVPMHKDEVLDAKTFPLRYAGFSNAYRREAGSYGKDTRGILRVHQFDKVEMVSFVKKGEDDAEHEYLLSLEENFFKALDIPFQVIKMCTGDLGFPAARKYDIEAWMPSQKKYREVTSVSTVTDFQSRRLKIRYRDGDTTEYAMILNGTAFAIGRTLIAILENYQQEDGSVVVPEVLREYVGKDVLTPLK